MNLFGLNGKKGGGDLIQTYDSYKPMEIDVEARVNKTEEEAKVVKALENMFPTIEFHREEDRIRGRGEGVNDLRALKEYLRLQKIRDSARSFLLGKLKGDVVEFQLNKQAAVMGKASFLDFDVALGGIRVRIKGGGLEEVLRWLCEKEEGEQSGEKRVREEG